MKLPILWFCVVHVLLTLSISSEAAELHPIDESAMRDLLTHIQGWPPAWQLGNVEAACGDNTTGSWPGLFCTIVDGYARVVGFKKGSFNSTQALLTGTIPESIANMTEISVIELNSQALYGTLPSRLFTMPKLESLRLFNNFFTGNLPTELGPTLQYLILRDNFFEGTLPEAMLSPMLIELSLSGNLLDCPLPLELFAKLMETRPSEGSPDCDINDNRFFMQADKICGTIPAGKYNCTILPQRDDIKAGVTDSIQAVAESTAIRLQVRGAAIEIIPLLSTGEASDEGHMVFKVDSIFQDRYFTKLKSFGSSFTKVGDSTWTITAEFTDGTSMLLDFALTTQEGEPYIKFGWTITSQHLPSTTKNLHMYIKLFAKTPLSTKDLYGCETTNMMEALELALENGIPELVLSDCPGTVTNVTTRVQIEPEGSYTSFEVRTPTLATTQRWSNVAFIDGVVRFLNIRSATLYLKEGLLTTSLLGRARRLGVASPIIAPAPAKEQFLGILLDLRYPPFNESIVYDPDIRFESLFALEEEVANYGWIAAVVVGAAIVIVVLVVALSPKARAAILPFTARSKDRTQRLTSAESNDNTADTTESGWVTRNPTTVELHNT